MHKNKVVHSFNLVGECKCVDVFRRDDGTFGFEEYRRDPEDGRGWFTIGFYGDQRFQSSADALAGAKAKVSWLEGVIGGK